MCWIISSGPHHACLEAAESRHNISVGRTARADNRFTYEKAIIEQASKPGRPAMTAENHTSAWRVRGGCRAADAQSARTL